MKSPKTVLIFAHECAPFHREGSTIGAQRPAQFAKNLPAFGWKTIVLCCDSKERRSITRKDLPEVLENVKKKLQEEHSNPCIILPLPSLKYDGFVDFMWYNLVNVKSNGTFEDKNRVTSLIRKPFTLVKFFFGDFSQTWIPVAKEVADLVSAETKIDCCIAEHGPDASIFLGKWYSRKYNTPWLADFRDPVLRFYTGVARKLYTYVVRNILNTARGTLNVNSYWCQIDYETFHLPTHVITNGFDNQEFNATFTPNATFTLSYFGNFNKAIQDIDVFLRGFKLFVEQLPEEEKNSVRFLYRGSGYEKILEKVAHLGIKEQLDNGPAVARPEAIRLMMQSDLLVLLSIAPYLPLDIFFKHGLHPGKTFEYFGARRPILVVPGDNGILDELIRKSNSGVIKGTETEISQYLYETFQQWKSGIQVAYNPNVEIVNWYTRENQTKELAKILDSLVT